MWLVRAGNNIGDNMATIFRFQLTESNLEVRFDQDYGQSSIVFKGMLQNNVDGGGWEDLTFIDVNLPPRSGRVDSLAVLKSEFIECLSAYYIHHEADMAAMETWLDDTEFLEETLELAVYQEPPE